MIKTFMLFLMTLVWSAACFGGNEFVGSSVPAVADGLDRHRLMETIKFEQGRNLLIGGFWGEETNSGKCSNDEVFEFLEDRMHVYNLAKKDRAVTNAKYQVRGNEITVMARWNGRQMSVTYLMEGKYAFGVKTCDFKRDRCKTIKKNPKKAMVRCDPEGRQIGKTDVRMD